MLVQDFVGQVTATATATSSDAVSSRDKARPDTKYCAKTKTNKKPHTLCM